VDAIDDGGLSCPWLRLRLLIGKCGITRNNKSLIRDLNFGRIDAALEKERNVSSVPALSDIGQEAILHAAHDRLLDGIGVQKARENRRGVKGVPDSARALFLECWRRVFPIMGHPNRISLNKGERSGVVLAA